MILVAAVYSFLAGWFWGLTRDSVREAYEAGYEAGVKSKLST